jgi:hypothetical protein
MHLWYHFTRNVPSAQQASVPHWHNELAAQRAFLPRLHNGRGHAARLAQRAFHKPDSPHLYPKGMTNTLPRVPNGLAFSCGERAAPESIKIGTISRAKRSAAMPGWTATSAYFVRECAERPPKLCGNANHFPVLIYNGGERLDLSVKKQ